MLAAFIVLLAEQLREPFVDDGFRHAVNASNSISDDGRLAATQDMGGRVRIWRIPAGANVQAQLADEFPTGLDTHLQDGRTAVIRLSSRGRAIAISLPQGMTRIYDLWPARHRLDFASVKNPGYVRWTPDDRRLLIHGETGPYVYSARNGEAKRLPIAAPYCFSVDGSLVAGFLRKGVAIASLVDLTIKERFETGLESFGPIGFSPDGRLLLCGGEDPNWHPPTEAMTEAGYVHERKIQVWDLRTGKRVRLIDGLMEPSLDDRLLHFVDRRRILLDGEIVEVLTGKKWKSPKQEPQFKEDIVTTRWYTAPDPSQPFVRKVVSFPKPAAWTHSAAFSPDGKELVLAAAYPTYELFLWDLKECTLRRRIRVQSGGDLTVAYSDDGRFLVSNGQKTFNFSQPLPEISPIASPFAGDPLFGGHSQSKLSPNRRYLVCEGPKSSLYVWDLRVRDAPVKLEGSFLHGTLLFSGFVGDGSKFVSEVRRPDRTSGSDIVCWTLSDGKVAWKRTDLDYGTLRVRRCMDRGRIAIVTFQVGDRGFEPKFFLNELDEASGQTVQRLEIARPIGLDYIPRSTDIALWTKSGLFILEQGKLRLISSQTEDTGMHDGDLAVSPGGELIALTMYGAPTRIYSRKTGAYLAALFQFPESGWVAFTPGGAISGSPAGLQRMRVRTPQGLRELKGPVRPGEVRASVADRR